MPSYIACMFFLMYTVKFVLYAGIKHHFYDVSFSPIHDIEDDGGIKKVFFRGMFISDNFRTYMRCYDENTQSARSCKEMIKFTHCRVEDLLDETHGQQNVIDDIYFRIAMNRLNIPKVDLGSDTIPPMVVKNEVTRNKYFTHVVATAIGDTYNCGHIELPHGFRNAYSKYGRSLNDVCGVCVTHKDSFKCARAGMWSLIMQEYKDGKVCFGDDRDQTERGTFEYDYEEYAEQQTIKEMMRNAGDLTAMVLLQGDLAKEIIINGLAVNYPTGFAKLLKLIIDFNKNKAQTICSSEPVDMVEGFNWLLNSIKS